MVADPAPITVIRRYWWIPLLALLISLMVGWMLTPAPAYETRFSATVLIPGDTEDTGRAERPELMVLDDLGPFIASQVFAEQVSERADGAIDAETVDGMLRGSRYSRVATVVISGDDRDTVAAVAGAAADAFPDAVNAYLVAPGDAPATVRVIDPPAEPDRDTAGRLIRVGAVGLIGAAAATALMWLLAPGRPSSRETTHPSGIEGGEIR